MSWRDHLVMILTSGAEIEHALMVQYLYAAYSIDGNQDSAGAPGDGRRLGAPASCRSPERRWGTS